jgi:hypothetical protein
VEETPALEIRKAAGILYFYQVLPSHIEPVAQIRVLIDGQPLLLGW